jgi:hypothetical protein
MGSRPVEDATVIVEGDRIHSDRQGPENGYHVEFAPNVTRQVPDAEPSERSGEELRHHEVDAVDVEAEMLGPVLELVERSSPADQGVPGE